MKEEAMMVTHTRYLVCYQKEDKAAESTRNEGYTNILSVELSADNTRLERYLKDHKFPKDNEVLVPVDVGFILISLGMCGKLSNNDSWFRSIKKEINNVTEPLVCRLIKINN